MSPKLELRTRVAPPDCHRTTWRITEPDYDPNTGEHFTRTTEFPCYYFRVSIANTGNTEAREVEVFASSLGRKRADGNFEEVPRFTPMNLVWAHVGRPDLSILSPHIPKMCDLAHLFQPEHRRRFGHDLPGVADNQAILALDLQVEPNNKGHLVEPGIYHLALVVAAANTSPQKYTPEINFAGDWFDDETKMLRDGLGIRLV